MDEQAKRSPQPFSIGDPKRNGVYSVLMGTVSFFIVPYIGIAAVVMGCFGIYFSIKQKSGVVAILLNLAGVVTGFLGFLAAQVTK